MTQVVIRPSFREYVSASYVRRIVTAVLEHEVVPTGTSLSVVITDDDELRSLNRQFRDIDAETDVLAFGNEPTEHAFVAAPDEPPYLGDVIISFPRVQAQAAERHCGVEVELGVLIAHGVLHLLGYDHAGPEQEAEMWGRQEAILSAIEGKRDA